MIDRNFLDKLICLINDHDFIDKWNFPTLIATEFLNYLKGGNELDKKTNFLSDHKFYTFNEISKDDFYQLVFPIFIESKNIFINNSISDFENFIIKLKYQIQKNHAKDIFNKNKPKENLGRSIISAAIFGFFKGEKYVYHEVVSGRGLIDILICSNIEIIIEVKLNTNYDPNSKQLDTYLRAGENRRGYYFILDYSKSFTSKQYCAIENNRFPQKKGINVIACHINQPIPSKN